MRIPKWRGVFPAVTTQFKPDQSLDLEATARHVEVLLDAGVSGIIMLGSLGENTALEPEEKREALAATVRTVRGRVPVLSGVAECGTATACRYARAMADLGVDGLLVMPAMVYRTDPRETVAHFRAIARATDLPLMLYNNPISYGVDLTPDLLAVLANEPHCVAVKESSADVRRLTDLRNHLSDRYLLFTGVDDLALESVLLGAEGWVAGLVNAFPDENQHLWDLAVAGAWTKARALYRWYMPLLHLDTHVKLVQYIKLAEQECGLGQEWVRAPRQTLVGEERRRVLEIIRQGIATRPKLPRRSRR